MANSEGTSSYYPFLRQETLEGLQQALQRVVAQQTRALSQLASTSLLIALAKAMSSDGTFQRIDSAMQGLSEAAHRRFLSQMPLSGLGQQMRFPSLPLPVSPFRAIDIRPLADPSHHLVARCDALEQESDRLQHENEQLRRTVRHYETHSPLDLPTHDVNGMFGSPS